METCLIHMVFLFFEFVFPIPRIELFLTDACLVNPWVCLASP